VTILETMKRYVPWSLRGFNPFLSAYGDSVLFRGIRATPRLHCNPSSDTGIHSAVPHRYLLAYLVAIKSFLHHHSDIAVFVHDDGSLVEEDKSLIRSHIDGVRIVDRAAADQRFHDQVKDPLLRKVRSSYTSYLKLFDPTLISDKRKIIIVDTDTLVLKRPSVVIDWISLGGLPWYHRVHPGKMKVATSSHFNLTKLQDVHIQTLITRDLGKINEELKRNYQFMPGFNSGFIGYENGTVSFAELRELFELLYARFSDRIFRWGAEQTAHGLILGSRGAQALPVEDYFVYTQRNADLAPTATFLHFIGENRFYRMQYPRLAARVIRDLRS
jgi:hypothetical protein